jgi:DegV family protein with EDD domain
MPPRIAIVTDTNASLPTDLAKRLHIYQVPQTVIFGEQSFEAVFQIDDAALFSRIDGTGRLPATAAPAPGRFAQAYQAALDSGADQVVCLCVSSEVSATYESARAACDLLPKGQVRVMDTRSLSMGQGFMVLASAEAAQSGASADEIITLAEEVRERTYLFATLATLKYLVMSGRAGHLAAGMAGLLNVKPILTIKNGKLQLLERVRTRGKSKERLIELVEQAAEGRHIERLAVVHVAIPDEALQFVEQARSCLPYKADILLSELNPGMSPHSGAGMLGIGFVAAPAGVWA